MKKFLATLLALSLVPFSFVGANAAVWGDADGNGSLTANDVAVVLQNVLSNAEYMNIADVDANNVIDSADAAIILQKVLDSSYTMPVEMNDTTEATTEVTTEVTTEETTEATTEVTTEATTESTTEVTTEMTTETTESTTENIPDNYISDDYELTPADLSNSKYFEEIGDFSSSTSERIRLYNNKLKFRVAGNANVYVTAKHASNTTPGTRTVTMTTSNGTYIASKDYEMGDPAEEVLYATVGRGAYELSSDDHINVYSIRVVLSEVDPDLTISTETESSTESTSEVTTEATTKNSEPATLPEVPSEITTTGNAVYVTNYYELTKAVEKSNVDIYIQDDIECTGQVRLPNQNANVNIIGVTKPDGTSPRIDFAKFRDSTTSTGSGAAGFRMSGTYYNFENLIIENAPDCGMRITGSASGHSLVKNCVFRYNNNSGISVTSGGGYNTFICVDSYRNGDIVQKCGDDADGFSVKLAAGDQNYFYNCRAYDNSDDGWDSYDRGEAVGDIYYIDCLAWNNGNPETFTGEYDYAKGFKLDKGLLYIQAVLKDNPDFETAYNNRTVTEWPKATIKLYGSKTRTYEQLHSSLWGGNPNGFKFGSADTPNTSYRYVENCIAFDHVGNIHQPVAKGYDQNNGSANYDIIGGISFDNVQNYWMDKMTALSQQGSAMSFNGENADALGNLDITTPAQETQDSVRAKVHEYRDNIYAMVNSNVIPGLQICDVTK